MRNIRLNASTVDRKCDIPHWFLSGRWPTHRTSRRMVTWLPKFLGWIDHQISSPWCSAINCHTAMLSPYSYCYIIRRQNTGQYICKKKKNGMMKQEYVGDYRVWWSLYFFQRWRIHPHPLIHELSDQWSPSPYIDLHSRYRYIRCHSLIGFHLGFLFWTKILRWRKVIQSDVSKFI